jgi:NAD(P)-dependent dehydrogenase (short-subunit alcohol dehydrogenase family)
MIDNGPTDDPFSVAGKVVIVTGGGTGIGASIAREFAVRGASVLIASRRASHLEPVRDAIRSEGGSCEAVVVDVRDPTVCESMVEAAVSLFGRLDVLVNNHGASIAASSRDLTPNGWKAVVEINLGGVFFASRTFADRLIKQGSGGSIINISSLAGILGSPAMPAYGASKAGIINLTLSHAAEWGRYGIRVNCIAPGPIETEGAAARTWPNERIKEGLLRSRALGRFGHVEEVAWPCLFLASSAAGYISGAVLTVDGGASLRYS